MIDFTPITIEKKDCYQTYLQDGRERGCGYSFANLYAWGRQSAAIVADHLVIFSQFNRRSVYPFPAGRGDKKTVLDAVIADAKERGIACRLVGLCEQDRQELEQWYPGRFRIHHDRDAHDYVYDIDDLADLKGRKYHQKRNHLHRFEAAYPDCVVEPITKANIPRVQGMIEQWYADRTAENPQSDFHMEQAALAKTMRHFEQLDMIGLLLRNGERVLAITMGSKLSEDTVDVQFEKARWDVDGAYAAINCYFARYVRDAHPQIRFLNREEDLGIEGLRKAKLSYNPHHMVEKQWACLLEDCYEY